MVADNVLLVPIFLALYVLLRRDNESLMAVATAFGFLGIVFFVASNPAFEMLALSDQYAAATTKAITIDLRCGRGGHARHLAGHGLPGRLHPGSFAGIAVGAVMLRSAVFSNVTGWMAILGNAVGLGLYVPVVGVYISVFSVLFLEIWYILISRRLFQLGAPVGVQSFETASSLRDGSRRPVG